MTEGWWHNTSIRYRLLVSLELTDLVKALRRVVGASWSLPWVRWARDDTGHITYLQIFVRSSDEASRVDALVMQFLLTGQVS